MRERLAPYPFIYAMWLEGADGNGTVDEYSDIDFNIDVEDANEAASIEAVETALAEIAPIDYRYVANHPHPKLRQRIYHLQGTDPYLMLDFNWQLHSRDPKESCLIEGNPIEAALVLFDKCGVIRHRPFDPAEFAPYHAELLADARYRYTQHVRAWKYVHRGTFPEAQAYYMRYVIEPLVTMLRVLHTPQNADYGMIHISQHLPPEVLARLTTLLQVASLEDIARGIPLAEQWAGELAPLLP